jgi:O-6-methylguanine DNA methyltransferase
MKSRGSVSGDLIRPRAAAKASRRGAPPELDVGYATVRPLGRLLAPRRGGSGRFEEPSRSTRPGSRLGRSPGYRVAAITGPARELDATSTATAASARRSTGRHPETSSGCSKRRRIPFGAVSTYGTVAKIAGSPRAARAAGNALHDNPVPIVVPCHRVVPSSGGIGKYGGQEWRKAFLLRLEGAIAAAD